MKTVWISLAMTSIVALQAMAHEPSSMPIDITTIRSRLSSLDPLMHAHGQLRIGTIDLYTKGANTEPDTKAFAIGGHLHFDTKRWQGLLVGVEGYFVMDPGLNSNDPQKINPDFFDTDKDGFATLSQAFIDGTWGHTTLKVGRQLIDTPHADSDDIRMMPNYFLAYMLSNNDIEGVTLHMGKIDQMGGWENGIDAKKFLSVEKVLGAPRGSNGIYLLGGEYDPLPNLSLQMWYYDFTDIADVVYCEAGFEASIKSVHLTFGLQYDWANDRGNALLGAIEAQTFGVSLEASFENGWTLLGAYNRDDKEGAFGSLGGGPFFTSLEDQTLDAIGQKGDAWILGMGYDFASLGVSGLHGSVAYGLFKADTKALYETAETDIALEYTIDDRLSLITAYAIIDDRTDSDADYNQFRLVANYNFTMEAK